MKGHLVLFLVALLQLSGGYGLALRKAENKFVVIGPNDDPHENDHTSNLRDDHEYAENYHENAENVVGDIHNNPEKPHYDPELVHNDVEVPNNNPEVPHKDVGVQTDNEDEELTDEDIEDILHFISELLKDEDFSILLDEYYKRNTIPRNERAVVGKQSYQKQIPHVRAKVVKHVRKYIEGKDGENGGIWNEEYDQDGYGKDYFNFIEARNIFGNSVGNDKVTNLYIFNYKDTEDNYEQENYEQENDEQENYEPENNEQENYDENDELENYEEKLGGSHKKNIIKEKSSIKHKIK